MFLNGNRINNQKREKISNIVDFIKENNERLVKKMIVFGSSIEDTCDEESDIDICLELMSDAISCSNKVFFNLYGNIEIVAENVCDVALYHKINRKLKIIMPSRL